MSLTHDRDITNNIGVNNMNQRPTKEELRDMLDKGMTLYKISRKYNTTIPVIFQLEIEYGINSWSFNLKYVITKEDIESMYVDERMTQEEIAKELGCSQTPVCNMMNYYHIPNRGRGRFTPQQRSSISDEIVRMYDDEHLTHEEIAKKVGYSTVHVGKILHEHDVQIRPCGKYTPQQRSSNADEITRMHSEGRNRQEIAKKVGCSKSHVHVILHECGVHIIGSGKYTPQQRSSNADEIVQRYNNGETEEEIAKKVGCSIGHVGRILHERGIPTRVSNGTITYQEMSLITADKIQECIDKGMNQAQIAEYFNISDATLYKLAEKFGISGMVGNYRCTTPEYQAWRDEVLIRDNYTCQLCGSQERPEVHHVIRWADALEYRYNVVNGVVLCHECHKKIKGHEYEYAQQFLDITQPGGI